MEFESIKYEYIIIIIFLIFLNFLLCLFIFKLSKCLEALEEYLRDFPKNIEEAQNLWIKLFSKNISGFSNLQDNTKAIKDIAKFFAIVSVMVLLKGLTSILR
ncbi:hypothetical protein [Cetobacterium sp.]|uniref:hypothetical protein n=1 Tax=Cetobacterium sp. TaxID=2071632 RepID=UPI003F326AB1